MLAGIIELGPSDNIALDQPRVAMELIKDVDPDPNVEQWVSVGPSVFNTFLLDTGANSVLAMATAVADMEGPPLAYETDGKFIEKGVAGDHPMDISAAYRFDFAGTSGVRHTLPDTRILSDPDNDFSIFGPWGIVGMPAMVNRVTSFDMTGWSGGGTGLDDLYMKTEFADQLPADEGHRYAIHVDNRLEFEAADGVVTGDPPVWADVPFLDAVPTHHGVGQQGNFLFDTGAQISVISEDLGIQIGLDTFEDGVLDEKDDSFVTWQQVGGVGGTVNAPVFAIDEVHIPAKQVSTDDDVELVWTDLQWLVLNIETGENQPSLDGVFGSDLLTSGWFHAFFYPGQPDGYIDKVHLDFREMDNGSGTVYLDLNESVDNVIVPGPGVRIRQTARSTDVAEGGADDTYSVVLTGEPTANVTVTLGNTDGQVTAVNDDDQSNQLVFDSTNWSTPQVVRVTAVDDVAAEGTHTGVITHTVTSGDGRYSNMAVPDVTVNVIDDDLHLITITEDQAGQSVITSIDVAEGGTATYWVALNDEPPSGSTIYVQLQDPTSQVNPTHNDGLLTDAVEFTDANWNVPQAVEVAGVDDALPEGPHQTQIVHTVYDFSDIFNPVTLGQSSFAVNISDNDIGGVVITETDGGTDLAEAGGTDTYQIALATAPTDDVQITVTADSQTRVSVDGTSFFPSRDLVFNSTNAQTITVRAVDDAVDEGNHTGRITHAVTGQVNDTMYPTTLSIDDVTAAITDNDSAGLRITSDQQGQNVITSVDVAEGGAEATYWVTLTSEPKAEVTVFLGSTGGQVTANGANQSTKLVFNATDWNIPQTVHVNAVDDDVAEGPHSDKIAHNAVSGDANYQGIVLFAINVTDNDSDSDNDGIDDDVEAGAPNNGDGNKDGIADNQQNHVASFPNALDGSYVTLAAPAGTTLVGVTAKDNPSPGNAPPGVNFPVGFFDYLIEGVGVGGSAVVTVYPESGTVVNTYYQYGPTGDDPADHWYPFMYDGETGAIIHADRIELHFVDGKRGDDDLSANGIIADPGAPGGTQFPWQNSALPEDVNCDTRVTTLDVLVLIADINSGGLGPLPATMDGSRIHTHYPDVDPNNELSPNDVLMTILYINAQAGGNPEGESPGHDLHLNSSGLLTDVAGQSSEIAALPHPVLAAIQSPYGQTVTADTIGHPEASRSSSSEPRSRSTFPSVGLRDAIRQTDVDRSPRTNASDQVLVSVDDNSLDSILDDIVPDVHRIWRTD